MTFKELQREWYAKLAESGFVDIELEDQRNIVAKLGNLGRGDVDRAARDNYYTSVSHALQSSYGHLHPRLMSDRQKVMVYALERHSDGASIRSICLELEASGLKPCRRNTIGSWIKQFVHNCGIRYYSEEEMRNL